MALCLLFFRMKVWIESDNRWAAWRQISELLSHHKWDQYAKYTEALQILQFKIPDLLGGQIILRDFPRRLLAAHSCTHLETGWSTDLTLPSLQAQFCPCPHPVLWVHLKNSLQHFFQMLYAPFYCTDEFWGAYHWWQGLEFLIKQPQGHHFCHLTDDHDKGFTPSALSLPLSPLSQLTISHQTIIMLLPLFRQRKLAYNIAEI